MKRKCRLFLPALLVAFAAFLFPDALRTSAQIAPPAVELRVSGAVNTPLSLSADDLKKMPRKTVSVMNSHEKRQETYAGVPVEEILKRAGVPEGEQMRGSAMASYVLAEAEDGYRVVFSAAELDSGMTDSEVIVADTMDGAPLGVKQGPFKLVAPHEKRPARWVRMLKSLTVVRLPAQ